ncbi:alpha/beta fold hydrolase [Streptomonospora litoralis]|uniref:Soluble epoxide hydrolase n=1 Tax=Streptomonospora litoralis TaxID=2498135 RepID=A0A4P6Q9M0_9ACTN|nr:alpha/beta hydrolase [Streptomonospora litoralis]QBI55787.1 Soluble epoxide hydrolase [Streptomonospora litoralis]
MPTGTPPSWETVVEGAGDGAPRLAVRRRDGTGVPLVLLHGLGGTLEEWEPVADLLAPRHPVYAVDQRGHGRSEDSAPTVEGHLADLARLVDRFGLHTPVVVGHDMGGVLAALFATRRRDLTAVVGIDAYGWPRADAVAEHLGLGCAEAAANAAAARAFVVDQMAAAFSPMPARVFDRLLESYQGGAFGLPGVVLQATTLRAAAREDHLVSPRPGPRALRALCAEFGAYDTGLLAAGLRVPYLSLVALRPPPRIPGAPARFNEILAAQAARELATSAHRRTPRSLDAAPPSHLTSPAAVAEEIERFLAELPR